MITKFGEITPQVIHDAYLITGYEPDALTYISPSLGKACALGIFTHMHDPKAFITSTNSHSEWRAVMGSLGINDVQECAFSDGFGYSSSSPHTTEEAYEAWATGRDCRDYLISKGMIP